MAESLTEELTAAQALKELESTAAEELTDAQAVALADDLAYPELTEAQEDALFADDEPKQPLPPPSPPLYDFRPETLAPVARQALAAVRAAGVGTKPWRSTTPAGASRPARRTSWPRARRCKMAPNCWARPWSAAGLSASGCASRPRRHAPDKTSSSRRQKGSAYATGWEHVEIALGSDEGWRRRGAAAGDVFPK